MFLQKYCGSFNYRSPAVAKDSTEFASHHHKRNERKRYQDGVELVDRVLVNIDDGITIKSASEEVKSWMQQFPLYPELG